MQGHRRRRATQRSPATSISPKGGGGTAAISLSRTRRRPARHKRHRIYGTRHLVTSASGFTLIEVMLSLVFLLVAAMALLQGLELAFRHYSLAQDRWKATLELWNQIEEIRATHSSRGEPLQIIPDSRPLYRTLLTDPRMGEHSGWEVLKSEK